MDGVDASTLYVSCWLKRLGFKDPYKRPRGTDQAEHRQFEHQIVAIVSHFRDVKIDRAKHTKKICFWVQPSYSLVYRLLAVSRRESPAAFLWCLELLVCLVQDVGKCEKGCGGRGAQVPRRYWYVSRFFPVPALLCFFYIVGSNQNSVFILKL